MMTDPTCGKGSGSFASGVSHPWNRCHCLLLGPLPDSSSLCLPLLVRSLRRGGSRASIPMILRLHSLASLPSWVTSDRQGIGHFPFVMTVLHLFCRSHRSPTRSPFSSRYSAPVWSSNPSASLTRCSPSRHSFCSAQRSCGFTRPSG